MPSPESEQFKPAEKEPSLDEIFKVDLEKEQEEILDLLQRLTPDQTFLDPFEYSPQSTRTKYSQTDIETEKWSSKDYKFAVEVLKKQKIDNFFNGLALQYETQGGSVSETIRTEHKRQIQANLDAGKAVLIRGHRTIGSSSLISSINKQNRKKSIYINLISLGKENLKPANFKKYLGENAIAEFIISQEEHKDRKQKINKRLEIREKTATAMQYLNNYLSQTDQQIYVFIDEAAAVASEKPNLAYLADLKKLCPNIKLAIQLTKSANYEKLYNQLFQDFNTHIISPLDFDKSQKLITAPLQNTSITCTRDAIQAIYRFTGGRPLDINILMDTTLHTKHKLTYTPDDIQNITQQNLQELGKSGIFNIAIQTYRDIYNHYLSKPEKKLIKQLVIQDKILSSKVKPNIAQSLLDYGLIKTIAKEDQKLYTINGELFKKVLQSELENH